MKSFSSETTKVAQAFKDKQYIISEAVKNKDGMVRHYSIKLNTNKIRLRAIKEILRLLEAKKDCAIKIKQGKLVLIVSPRHGEMAIPQFEVEDKPIEKLLEEEALSNDISAEIDNFSADFKESP